MATFNLISSYFFTQTEPDLPQAAQLGIRFFYNFHNTQLETHLLEGTD